MNYIQINYCEDNNRSEYHLNGVYVASLWFSDDRLEVDYSNDNLPEIDEEQLRAEMYADRDAYYEEINTIRDTEGFIRSNFYNY